MKSESFKGNTPIKRKQKIIRIHLEFAYFSLFLTHFGRNDKYVYTLP